MLHALPSALLVLSGALNATSDGPVVDQPLVVMMRDANGAVPEVRVALVADGACADARSATPADANGIARLHRRVPQWQLMPHVQAFRLCFERPGWTQQSWRWSDDGTQPLILRCHWAENGDAAQCVRATAFEWRRAVLGGAVVECAEPHAGLGLCRADPEVPDGSDG